MVARVFTMMSPFALVKTVSNNFNISLVSGLRFQENSKTKCLDTMFRYTLQL